MSGRARAKDDDTDVAREIRARFRIDIPGYLGGYFGVAAVAFVIASITAFDAGSALGNLFAALAAVCAVVVVIAILGVVARQRARRHRA